eukprot:1100420-Pleurochrysis_carterae.AAC.1
MCKGVRRCHLRYVSRLSQPRTCCPPLDSWVDGAAGKGNTQLGRGKATQETCARQQRSSEPVGPTDEFLLSARAHNGKIRVISQNL